MKKFKYQSVSALFQRLMVCILSFCSEIIQAILPTQNRELAVIPVQSTTFGTSGGGTFKRVSVAWLLEFYFKE